MDTERALDGIRVIDLTQVMAGPYCCMLLGDMGADVIKVEPPGGEATRDTWRSRSRPASPAPFLAVNRNKRGLTLDLKRPEAVAVLKRLVATADVLVENYRPGVARRLGIDYETLRQINPRLVYCSISGFGQTGPYADRGGYDLIAQGMSGIMSATGSADGPPVKVGVPITDLGAGPLRRVRHPLRAARAARDGARPARRHLALRGGAGALGVGGDRVLVHGTDPAPASARPIASTRPYQAFRASDGRFTVGAANSRLWPRFCAHPRARPPRGRRALCHRRRSPREPARARARDRGRHGRTDARALARAVRGGGHPGRARSTACPRRSPTRTRWRAAWCRSTTTPAPGASRRSAIR